MAMIKRISRALLVLLAGMFLGGVVAGSCAGCGKGGAIAVRMTDDDRALMRRFNAAAARMESELRELNRNLEQLPAGLQDVRDMGDRLDITLRGLDLWQLLGLRSKRSETTTVPGED